MPPMLPSMVAPIQGQTRQPGARVLYWSELEIYTHPFLNIGEGGRTGQAIFIKQTRSLRNVHTLRHSFTKLSVHQKKNLSPLVLLLTGSHTT